MGEEIESNESVKQLPAVIEDIQQKTEDPPEEATIEQVRAMLEMNERGQPDNSPKNYETVFLFDPLLKGAFCTNQLTDQIDVVKPLGWKRDSDHVTDVDIQYLLLYLDKNYSLASEKRIEGVIQVAANENRYHPIQIYLNSLEWDGQERVRYALHHFLGAEVSEYNYQVLRLFMLGAAARVFKPGTKFEYMLCLVGSQGVGKSTFFRLLAIKDEWFSDDLRRLEDDNVYRKLQGHWIIEMSEMLATAKARSIEDIKSFLSRQSDTYKVPYAVHPKDYKRQCVFAGTSNTLDFLPLDRTGNRRFLPVQCHADQAEIHILEDEAASRAYIDQMWAEIMVIYRQGNYKLTLDKEMEEYTAVVQKDFMPEDTLAVRIRNYLDDYQGNIICSLKIYHEALGHGMYEEPKQYEIRDINSIMNNYANDWKPFDNPRHFPQPYGRQKGWERISEADNGGIEKNNFKHVTEEQAIQMGLPEEWLKP